jgi:hypothetical protein
LSFAFLMLKILQSADLKDRTGTSDAIAALASRRSPRPFDDNLPPDLCKVTVEPRPGQNPQALLARRSYPASPDQCATTRHQHGKC